MFYLYRHIWTAKSLCLRKYCIEKGIFRSKDDMCFDVSVIGGGIIGTSIAREVSDKSKSIKTILIEKESGLGKHQSSHNSGVIHSGVFYRPDSLKAKLSRKGVDLVLKYCDENEIAYKIFGKLVVATNTSKLNDLRILHERGVVNKVEGLEMLWTKEKIKRIEPKCNGIQALWCPKVGNIDWGILTESLGKKFQSNGGTILLNNQVDVIEESDRPDHPIFIKTKQGNTFKSKYLIICGGLHSEVLSSIIDKGSKEKSSLISLRVDYQFVKTNPIGTNIYGVPDLQIPFLGIHITPKLNGGLLLGPNAVPAFKIEGYIGDEVNFTYLKDTVTSTSFQNMTRRYFPQCFGQVKKAVCPRFQVEELQYLADMSVDDIQKGPAAVLGQLVNADGSFVDDFKIEFFEGKGIGGRVINCKFLPSPAATCSLAIGKYVAKKLFQQFKI